MIASRERSSLLQCSRASLYARRIRWRAAVTFVSLLACADPSWAAHSTYCAQRISNTVLTGSECFDTLEKAEAFLRAEPSPPVGNSLMVQVRQTPLGLGRVQLNYHVRPVPAALVGSWYYAVASLGGAIDCRTRVALSTVIAYGCPTEASVVSAVFQSANYRSLVNGGLTGDYLGDPPSAWDGTDAQRDSATGLTHVLVRRGGRSLRVLTANGGAVFESAMPFFRLDAYACPPNFLAGSSGNTRWPHVCFALPTGVINVTSAQYCAPGVTRGNPCNAATGNKEYRETDFEWEGMPFTRAYNSTRDFELRSGLGDNWAHSFSDRLIMRSSVTSDMLWLRSNGYFEVFSEVASGQYRSRNEVGIRMSREPDAVAATLGRWRVALPTGRRMWFNEAGRLVRIVDGARTLALSYCSAAEVAAGACLSTDALRSVNSASGRSLEFEYGNVAVEVAPGVSRSEVMLTRIRTAGQPVAEYDYDGRARLVAARVGWPAPQPGRSYRYAEPEALCRSSSGAVSAGCDPAQFVNHLTGVLDETGVRVASYRYDERGLVTASEGPGGVGRVSLSYGPLASEVTLPNGAREFFQFASGAFWKPTQSRLTGSDGVVAALSTAAYADHRLTHRVAADGSRTNFAYGTYHETSRTEGLSASGATLPETRIVQTDWHPELNVVTERRVLTAAGALVARSTWTYNDRAQVTSASEIDPAGGAARTTAYGYCTAADVAAALCPFEGLLMAVDGPRTDVADVTRYGHHASTTADAWRGDVSSITNALGQTIRLTRYHALGQPLELIDANGIVTRYEYDHRQRITRQTIGSETTVYEYLPNGLLWRMTLPDGALLRYEYDAAQRRTAVADGLGNRIDYTLDNAGQVQAENARDPDGVLRRALARTFDSQGRIQTITGRELMP